MSANAAAIGVGNKLEAPGVPNPNRLFPNEKLGKLVIKLGSVLDAAPEVDGAPGPPAVPPMSSKPVPLSPAVPIRPKSPPDVDRPMNGRLSPNPPPLPSPCSLEKSPEAPPVPVPIRPEPAAAAAAAAWKYANIKLGSMAGTELAAEVDDALPSAPDDLPAAPTAALATAMGDSTGLELWPSSPDADAAAAAAMTYG